jgi:hypothetical protein
MRLPAAERTRLKRRRAFVASMANVRIGGRWGRTRHGWGHVVIIERSPAGIACAIYSRADAFASPYLYADAGRALGAAFDWCQPPAGQRPIWRDEQGNSDTSIQPQSSPPEAPASAVYGSGGDDAGRLVRVPCAAGDAVSTTGGSRESRPHEGVDRAMDVLD